MNERKNAAHSLPPVSRSICSLVVAQDGMLALVVGGSERWRNANGYTFIPAELPAGELDGEATGDALAQLVPAIALRWLGCEATPLSSDALYGPSERHAIDRLATATQSDMPLPLLYLERGMALSEKVGDGDADAQDHGDMPLFSRVVVRAYRAELLAEPQPGATTAGLLWLAPHALRMALRGVPLADLLAQPGVGWQQAAHIAIPSNAFIFVPADYGERHMLRIAAKYGPQKLGLPVTMRDEQGL